MSQCGSKMRFILITYMLIQFNNVFSKFNSTNFMICKSHLTIIQAHQSENALKISRNYELFSLILADPFSHSFIQAYSVATVPFFVGITISYSFFCEASFSE